MTSERIRKLQEEIRDDQWRELRGRLRGKRQMIWEWMQGRPPLSTQEIARGTGLPLLTVRPRLTELCQHGFAECVGRCAEGGKYVAFPLEVARAEFEKKESPQMSLL